MLSVEATTVRVQFDGGPAILAMLRDLTDRKRMQAQLLLSDRLASVGVLAAGIAHEINNPLAFVMANLDVLARKALPEMLLLAHDDDDRARIAKAAEMIEQSRVGAERMRRIVRDVKTFARGDDETREPVDVQSSLDAALQLVAHELRRRARVVRDFAPVPRVEANESRLGQVFLNLLVNALQALPEDGEHEVRVRVSAPDRRHGARRSDRHRRRDPARRPVARVRSVLHDQAHRRGHGPRPVRLPGDRHWDRSAARSSIESEVGKGTTVQRPTCPAITGPRDRGARPGRRRR